MTQPSALIEGGTSDQPDVNDDRARLEADLAIAERVHRSMIPANQRRGDLEIACDFRPMMAVGGDYASVHFQNDHRVVVGVCDVSGHGVASALLATRVNSFVLSQAPHVCHHCQLVEALNDFLCRTFRETNLYVTFFSLFIDLDRGTVVGAGCGHPPVLLYVNGEDTIRRLESANTPIGLVPDLRRTCSMVQVPFKPGDRLVLYTDGVTESTNRAGQQLGVGGLEDYFKASARLPPRRCLEAMSDRVHAFRNGVAARDDQLLLEIAYHGATAQTT